MIYHQSNAFLQDWLNSFHCWLNLFHSSFRSASTILGGVSRRNSQILKTEEEFFLHILSVLSQMRDSSLLPSSHNCFNCDNSFHPSEAIQESSQFDYPESTISGLFFLNFQLSFSKSYWCIIKVFSYQFVIYSFSYIKFPKVSSFIL